MVPGIVYSWSWTILLDELEMYQFFATLSVHIIGNGLFTNGSYLGIHGWDYQWVIQAISILLPKC